MKNSTSDEYELAQRRRAVVRRSQRKLREQFALSCVIGLTVTTGAFTLLLVVQVTARINLLGLAVFLAVAGLSWLPSLALANRQYRPSPAARTNDREGM